MSFSLDAIVPWGRSFQEYVHFFDLDEVDLQKWILGCADGPAGFNSRLSFHEGFVISCDPVYRYSGDEIRARIEVFSEVVLEQVRENHGVFLWNYFCSPEELGWSRFSDMNEF